MDSPLQLRGTPTNPRKACLRLRAITQLNSPDLRAGIIEIAIGLLHDHVHRVFERFGLDLFRHRHRPLRIPAPMGAARLVLPRMGLVEGVDPGIARRTAELRHPDVPDGPVDRGDFEVEHGDQRALAVHGAVERHRGRIAQNEIEAVLDARPDDVDLVVEAGPRGEDGPDEVLDFRDHRDHDLRNPGIFGLPGDLDGAGEVGAAVNAVGVREEMQDVAEVARELYDRAVQRDGELLAGGFGVDIDHSWRDT